MAGGAVGGGDVEEERPLAIQRLVSAEQAACGVVDVRRFGRHAVQLHDGEITTGLEGVDIAVAQVEAAEVEAVDRAEHVINRMFQLGCDQMAAVAEESALAMVAG